MREDLFTVVMEQFPTDTVDYADIVLPATMQTEHLDVNDGYGHILRPPQPPGGRAAPARRCRRLETFRRLARAMDLDEPALYDDDETLARTLLGDDALRASCGSDGWKRYLPEPYVPFTDGFPTPSGKLEFFSEKRRGRRPTTRCPATRRRAMPDADEHPLALIAPASHWFLNTIFANKPDLMKRPAARGSTLHPDDASARGLRDRRHARASSTRAASSSRRVEISDRVRPGVIASTKGHWLKHVRGGANVNATIEERDADMGGGAIYHDNRVEVEAVPVDAAGSAFAERFVIS